jgi:Icc-related predicted phosphoesterase
MKILFFSDNHGNNRMLDNILLKSRKSDAVVCAGDFTIFENDMLEILKKLNSIGKPIILIHGNHETASEVILCCERLSNIHFIHKKYYIIENIVFFGYGGGGFSSTDSKFVIESNKFITSYPSIVDSIKSSNENTEVKLILVTHQPAFGTKLDLLDVHVGNKSITDFIVKYQPTIAVSGHIHETAGYEDKIKNTRVINPAWNGMIIDL